MHCVQTAELAALISQHGQSILYRAPMIRAESMSAYWAASRSRFGLWHEAIRRHRVAEECDTWLPLRAWWRGHLPVLEEILVSELLTRVVAVIGTGVDASNGTDELAPVTQSVHLAHLESRNRVMNLILDGRGASVSEKVRLNRLRQAVERWTDTLVGRMCVDRPELMSYAIDRKRAESYAADTRELTTAAYRQTSDELMNAAMSDTLRRRCGVATANSQSNDSVVDTVLAMLEPVLFDGFGNTKSIFVHRRENDWTLSDTQAAPRTPSSTIEPEDVLGTFERQD